MTDKHICPWWLAYTFDNPLRRYFHDPQAILMPYLREGMTAIDLGCGMGYFSRAMAKIVGDAGKVISVDLQTKMLDITRRRAEKDGVVHRIRFLLASEDDLGVTEQVDFALAFWMVHEVTDKRSFFRQSYRVLKPAGTFLIAEPKMHVTQARFDSILPFAEEAGFHVTAKPSIRLSRSMICKKKDRLENPGAPSDSTCPAIAQSLH
ncbi:MAG: class I SAM-dependent methyltransferase [Nitrospirota bacterium]